MIQRMRKAQEGFTLIELVVVVAILGILAVIVTPKVLGAMDNAKKNSSLSSAKQIQVGIERMYAESGSYFTPDKCSNKSADSSATTAVTCDMATLKGTLSKYVNLDTVTITGATYQLGTPTGGYTMVLTFSSASTGQSITLTPDSVAVTSASN